ncbi:MAG TPA: PTS transporter subunit EIIB [Cellulomonas sp.]
MTGLGLGVGGGAEDDGVLAAAVLSLVGGPGNVTWVGACSSRLRLVLRDDAARDDDGLRALPGVLLVVVQGGQLQLALGGRALPVSRALRALLPDG